MEHDRLILKVLRLTFKFTLLTKWTFIHSFIYQTCCDFINYCGEHKPWSQSGEFRKGNERSSWDVPIQPTACSDDTFPISRQVIFSSSINPCTVMQRWQEFTFTQSTLDPLTLFQPALPGVLCLTPLRGVTEPELMVLMSHIDSGSRTGKHTRNDVDKQRRYMLHKFVSKESSKYVIFKLVQLDSKRCHLATVLQL